MTTQLTRRDLLARSITAAGAMALAPATLVAGAGAHAAGDEFWRLDGTAQAALVRSGDVSALELVDAAIARIETVNPRLNAVVLGLFERAREAARGPLPQGPFAGVPYLIKDLNDIAGVPTSMGSRLFRSHVPDHTGSYVQRVLDAGLIPVGKSNTPEFGLLATTESLQLGVCRNPWNTAHTPGGSSGGAGAAVAAGLVPFAHATDGGGSIRIPAACCGLFGLKPSRGRDHHSESSEEMNISVHHCVSRSVRDSAALFAAAENRGAGARYAPVGKVGGPGTKRLRIAFSNRSYTGAQPHPDVAAATRAAAELCAALGHNVEEASADVDGEAFITQFMTVWSSGPANLQRLALSRGMAPAAVLEPWTLGLADLFNGLPPDAIARAHDHFRHVARIYAAFFERYDVILTPTLSAPPVRVGTQQPRDDFDDLYARLLDWVDYTPVHNAAGNAAMSVPLGWSSEDLPIGIQFAAAPGAERTLFELAFELEAAAPWAERWPRLA